jgi:calcineurin-like phosphoesterase family protein
MAVYFTSDSHFFHDRIREYSKRPFASLEEMHDTLIKNWYDVVKPEDEVYHLGDLALVARSKKDQVADIVRQLPGTKHLVLGNHDRLSRTDYKEMGFEVHTMARIFMDGQRILMAHGPHRLEGHDFDLGLCGHVHERWAETVQRGKRIINVGVDVRNFRPVTLEELTRR